MNDKLSVLLERIQYLEHELLAEIGRKEAQFSYEIRDRKAHFTSAVAAQHRRLAKTIASYVRESKIFNLITAPVIWLVLVPCKPTHPPDDWNRIQWRARLTFDWIDSSNGSPDTCRNS